MKNIPLLCGIIRIIAVQIQPSFATPLTGMTMDRVAQFILGQIVPYNEHT